MCRYSTETSQIGTTHNIVLKDALFYRTVFGRKKWLSWRMLHASTENLFINWKGGMKFIAAWRFECITVGDASHWPCCILAESHTAVRQRSPPLSPAKVQGMTEGHVHSRNLADIKLFCHLCLVEKVTKYRTRFFPKFIFGFTQTLL